MPPPSLISIICTLLPTTCALCRALRRLAAPTIAWLGNIARIIVVWSRNTLLPTICTLCRALHRLATLTIARLRNVARIIVFWWRKIIPQVTSFARKKMSSHDLDARSDFEYLCWFLLIYGFALSIALSIAYDIGIGIIGSILGGISESIETGFLYAFIGIIIILVLYVFMGAIIVLVCISLMAWLMALGCLITMASLRNIWASLKANKQQKDSRGRNQGEYGYSGNSSDHSQHERTNATHKTDRERAAEILGIPPNTSFAKAKKSYRKLMMKHHPDRGGNEERAKSLTWAMRVFEKHSDLPESETH